MRFSDIRKFWESHLGGHGSRSSQASGSFKTGSSGKHGAKRNSDKSIRSRFFTDRSSDSKTNEAADARPLPTRASSKSLLTQARRGKVVCGDADRSVTNACRTNTEGDTWASSDAQSKDNITLCGGERHCNINNNPSQSIVDTTLVQSPSAARIQQVRAEYEGSVESDEYLFSTASHISREFDGPKNQTTEKYALRHNAVQSVIVKFTPEIERRTSQSKAQTAFDESLEYSVYNKSEPQLNVMKPHRRPMSVCTDSTSAPASVNSSPLRSVKGGSKLAQDNVKFNQVQNFWKMREKKLVKRSVQQRRCLVCGCYLNNCFYEQDGALYCNDDYWSKFGHCCKKCGLIITGPIMIAGMHRFHPECFECNCCKTFISDGDLYALVLYSQEADNQRSKLFCSACFQGSMLENDIAGTHEGVSSHNKKYAVIMVVDFYPILNSNKQEASFSKEVNQPYTMGYGITVRDPPVTLPTTDGINQPTGQVVCRIDVESSLQVGDLVLQVNGLSVDHNALDLVDRLYDDSGTPLLLTVQREVLLSTAVYNGSGTCTHHVSNHSPNTVSSSSTPSTSKENDVTDFAFDNVVQMQPRHSDKNQLIGGDITTDNLHSITTTADTTNEDSQSYCNPFMFPTTNNLCCTSDNLSSVQKRGPYMIGNEPIEISHERLDESACSDAESEETVSSYENTVDSGVEEDNGVSSDYENLNIENQSECNLCMRNSSANDIDMNKTPQANSPSHISSTTYGRNSIEEPDTTANALIIQENELLSSNALDADSSEHVMLPTQNEKDNSIVDLIINESVSKNSALELITNDSVVKTLNNQSKDDNHDPKEDLPPISPRVKRGGIKRKPSRVEQLRDKMQIKKITSEIRQIELVQKTPADTVKEPARRSNSLRTDIPMIVMRKSSPRAKVQIPMSTFSVYNPTSPSQCGGTDLNRSESMRIYGTHMAGSQRVFRPCDLILGDVLGQGFFGKAIKVTHRDTGEVMVLKVLNSLDEEIEKSFLKEVKVMKNLFHQNVLRFIGVLYKDRKLNIITEFVACGTLKDLLSNMEEALSWHERVRIAHDISSGMSYLHSMLIIHRDLNSGNCFVKDNGTVVVADFGLARVLSNQTNSLNRRKRYTVVGNPYWMAPEMLYGNMYDERVDVFSFGIVLCEIIGRVEADPDFLPRSNDFGLAVLAFHSKFCKTCPAFYFAIAVHASCLNPDDRPSFKELEEWFQMMEIREDMPDLPEPPHLHELIVSVYEQYDLTLPEDLYYSPDDGDDFDFPPGELVRSSSVISIKSVSSDNDLNSPRDNRTLPRSRRNTIRGTGFFASATISDRL